MLELAIAQLTGAVQQFRAWVRDNPWPVYMLSAGAIIFLWLLIQTIRLDNMGFREHSFWDWMELLIVPAVIATGVWWLNREERQTEREIASDRRHQGTLEAYFDRMTQLLLEEDLGRNDRNEEADDVEGGKRGHLAASIARARTLAVLRTLDPARVSAVIRFLLETKVGEKSLAEIVPLAGGNLRGVKWLGPQASLREAQLSGADLSEANLNRANLSKANLSGAHLLYANLGSAYLTEANLTGAFLVGADLTRAKLGQADLGWALLAMADLTGANLVKADLRGAGLSGANLSEADLSKVDLSEADLAGATVTTDQLLQARTLEEATMPDGTKYEEWIKRQETEQAEPHEQDD